MRASTWETVHVFVSSTFADMHAERDFLVKRVFPRVREWCEKRKLHFVDIDLRWGVTEADASGNRNAVQVCLDRIDQCRPFFLCFVGQRYGWIPGAGDVSGATFERFPGLDRAVDEGRSMTDLEVLHAVSRALRGPEDGDGPGWHPAEHAFFYLRDPSYLSEMGTTGVPGYLHRTYTDEAEPDEALRAHLLDMQADLRQRIGATGRPARPYEARWRAESRTPELALPLRCPSDLPETIDRWRSTWRGAAGVEPVDLDIAGDPGQAAEARAFNEGLTSGRLGDFTCDGDPLEEVVVRDLQAAIAEHFPDRGEAAYQSPLQRELDQQAQFAAAAAEGFIPREGDFDELDRYADGDDPRLLAVVAPAGAGKSTLLANWTARRRNRAGADETVHARFIGASEQTATADGLLRLLCEELRAVGKLEREIPDEPVALRGAWPAILGEVGSNGRTVIVLDGLNQLQRGLDDLAWLLRQPPRGVRLVVSFKLGEAAGDALRESLERDPRVRIHHVPPFDSLEDRRQLVRAYLSRHLKELDDRYLEALVRSDAAANPLWLKIVLSELRVFGAFDQLGEVLARGLGDTPLAAFDAVLRRLESDPAHAAIPPQVAVPLLFGSLAYARGGLPDGVLVRVFLRDLDLTGERRGAVEDTIQLLLRQVRPFLARRHGRHDYFYESFQLAARARYSGDGPGQRPAEAWHELLASVCRDWPDLSDEAERYALSHLPRHLMDAEQGEAAAEVLTDFAYLHRRHQALGPDQTSALIEEMAAAHPAAGSNSEPLEEWCRFYSSTAHLLRRSWPGLDHGTALLQQAYADGSASPVGEAAERWVVQNRSPTHWLRAVRRPERPRRAVCLRILDGHTDSVVRVAVDPTGRRVFSGGADGSLRVWDWDTGECTQVLEVGTRVGETTIWPAILPDGRRIFGSWLGFLKIWDAGDLQRGAFRPRWGHIPTGGPRPVHTCLAVSLDGSLAAIGSGDGLLQVWRVTDDMMNGTCVFETEVEGSRALVHPIRDVAFSPDSRLLVSASGAKVRVWEIPSGTCVRTFVGPARSVRVLTDGSGVVTAGDDGTIRVWDVRDGSCRKTITLRSKFPSGITLSPDGRRVLCGDDGVLGMWDLRSGRCLGEFAGHSKQINATAMHPSGRSAITGGFDQTVRVWDLRAAIAEFDAEEHRADVQCLAVDDAGLSAASGAWDGGLSTWDLVSGRRATALVGHKNVPWQVAFLPGGDRAISVGSDASTRIWDIGTGECVTVFEEEPRQDSSGKVVYWFSAVSPHPDGRRALVACRYQKMKMLDVKTGECLQVFDGLEEGAREIEIAPDGIRARSSSRAEFREWNLETGQCTLRQGVRGWDAQTTLFHPDWKRVICGCWAGPVTVRDLVSGDVLFELEGHDPWVNAVALHPDGRRVLSAGKDTTVRLWDIDTGECLAVLDGHSAPVTHVAFSPDGRLAVSAAEDRTIVAWDVLLERVLATWPVSLGVTQLKVTRNRIIAFAREAAILELVPAGRWRSREIEEATS